MLNFIRHLDAQCDELVMTTMRREYGYLLQIGSLFLILRPKWWILSILQLIVFNTVAVYFIIILAVTSTQWDDDINNVSQSVHFTSLMIVTQLVLLVFSFYRSRLVDLMVISGNHYYTYKDGFRSAKEHQWRAHIRKLKIALLVAIPLYFCFCVTVLITSPMLDTSYEDMNIGDGYINSIYMKTPIPMTFPYKIDNELVSQLSSLSQVVAGAVVSFVIAGADLLLIFFSQEIALQMKILRDSIQSIEVRALTVYNKLNGVKPAKKTMRHIYRDHRYMDIVHWCMKQNVEHHKVICRAFDHIFQIGKWPLGAAFFFGSAVIAFSLFSFISSDSSQIMHQLLSLMLLIAEAGNMLMICTIGQQLTDMSNGIYDDWYNLKWRHWNKRCKLSMMIFKERLKKPLVLSALGLTPINMEMFANILNTAYSYFNLMYALYTDNGK